MSFFASHGSVWFAAIALLVATTGCGPDNGTGEGDDTGGTGADTGTAADTGPLAETGTRDGSAPEDDAGSAYACTYFPDNCGDGEACYPDVGDQGVERVCREYNADKATGDDCKNPTDCAKRDRCVDGTCRNVCDPDAGTACGQQEVCLALTAKGHSLALGICEPKADRCTTWPNDDCGDGKNCYKLDQGKRCLTYDAGAEAGDACQGHQDCNAGQSCIDAEGESKAYCRDKCDDDHPCDAGKCRDLTGVSYGACIPESG